MIASDGGLLPEPVKVSELPVLMGERFEVLVEVNDNNPFDLGDAAGQPDGNGDCAF